MIQGMLREFPPSPQKNERRVAPPLASCCLSPKAQVHFGSPSLVAPLEPAVLPT